MRQRDLKHAEAEQRRTDKIKSPFVSFFITAVGVILMLAVTFAFVVFKTDGFMVVDDSMVTSSAARPATTTSVSILMSQVDDEKDNPDPDTNPPGIPDGPGSPPSPNVTDDEVAKDIANGLYTADDYNYLVALGGESGSYDGFYAVACCVRNRVTASGGTQTIKDVVTAPGQFAGYNENEVGKPRNEDVKQAAVAMLRGGASTIGDCRYFFGRVTGYDLWAEPDISEFYNVGYNIYYSEYGKLHNKKNNKTAGAIIIYDNSTKTWLYDNNSSYRK